MGISKSKIRSWNLPELLWIIALSLLIQIIIIFYYYSQYNIDITFLIKASEECDKGENVEIGLIGNAAASSLKSRL